MFVFLHLFIVISDSRDFPHIQLDLLQNLQNGGKSKPEPDGGLWTTESTDFYPAYTLARHLCHDRPQSTAKVVTGKD